MAETEKNIVLKLANISVSFSRTYKKNGEDFKERREILKNISLTLKKGEITALTGGNGSGKTTLFNVISGLLVPDNGKIFFNGDDISGLPVHKRARLGIGRLFQDNHIFPNLSVLDNMLISSSETFGEFPFASLFAKRKELIIEKKRIEKAEKVFGELFQNSNESLLRKKHRLAGELSYGQKRLLGLARIFMGRYDLILLDEPSAGVNEALLPNIMNMVEKLAEKHVSIFIIDHEAEFIKKIADKIIYLKDGEIDFQERTEKSLKQIGD